MKSATWCLVVAVVVWNQQELRAEFANVVNVPPQAAPTSIGSDTQLNVLDGGIVGNFFSAGAVDGSSTNVEVNVMGGGIGSDFSANRGATVNIMGGYVGGWFDANAGSVINISGGIVADLLEARGSQVNISGGSVGDIKAYLDSVIRVSGGSTGDSLLFGDGSTLIVTGGSVGDVRAESGSTVAISGGTVATGFSAEAGSVVEISGGEVGSYFYISGAVNISGGIVGDSGISMDMYAGSEINITGGAIGDGLYAWNSQLNITGSDFRLNGAPIAGLELPGSSLQVNFPTASVFTCTLADGTPLHLLMNASEDGTHSTIRDGSLTLHTVTLPEVGSTHINVPVDPAPLGLRAGQTMIVDTGGIVGRNFTAGNGSTVIVQDGLIGNNFEVMDADVTINGGQVGGAFTAYEGSQVDIAGGTIGPNSRAEAGSNVTISGGEIGEYFVAASGSEVHISGGKIGRIGRSFIARGLSGLTISGGKFAAELFGIPKFIGGEFYLNGQPLAGLESVGNEVTAQIPANSVLSGTFPDGTTFAFSGLDGDGIFRASFVAAALPPIEAAPIVVSYEHEPKGVRNGEHLIVTSGGKIGDHFNAAVGSLVEVKGGQIGDDFEVDTARVEISGGSVGKYLETFPGSVVTITGGSLGSFAKAGIGSIVNIQGGTVGSSFDAFGQSRVNIAGGQVGDFFEAKSNSVVSIFGGQVGAHYDATSGSTTNISGGEVGDDFDATSGSKVNLIGQQFVLNGVDITSSLANYAPFTISNRNVILSGLLADGSPFSFNLKSSDTNTDYFSTGAILTVALGVAGDFDRNGQVDAADYTKWRDSVGLSGVGLAADANGDSTVNTLDYVVWKNNFGASVGGGSSGSAIFAVPEPGTILLLLIGYLGVGFCRRELR